MHLLNSSTALKITAQLACLALIVALGACSDDDESGVPATGETSGTAATGGTGDTTPTGDTPGTTPTGDTPGTTPTGDTPGTTPTGDTPGSTLLCGTDETLCTADDDTQYCADLDTDASNCGACGAFCELTNADARCVNGTCEIDTCVDDFWASCDGDDATGCETNTDSSNRHCGACDTPCDLPGALSTCDAGECTLIACLEDEDENPLFANCDEDDATGCEADLLNSLEHCGACGNDLTELNNVANVRCEDGVPDIRACDEGFANCDGDWENGCEASISADATCGPTCLDCGALGDGTVSFTCQPIGNTFTCQDSGCAAGFGTCGSDEECQTNLLTSNEHCGACNEACTALNNSSATCVAGECEITCDGDRELCPGILGSQVCADLQTSRNNCGACGNGCDSGEECVNGQCRCAQGFTTCDGACVDLQSDRNHCGSCGNDCPGTGQGGLFGIPDRCEDGSCFCEEGTTYCRGATASNQPSCCNAVTETCEGPALGSRSCQCALGYTDCGTAGNRNCVDTRRNRSHCGSCGNVCGLGQFCVSGTCQFLTFP